MKSRLSFFYSSLSNPSSKDMSTFEAFLSADLEVGSLDVKDFLVFCAFKHRDVSFLIPSSYCTSCS